MYNELIFSFEQKKVLFSNADSTFHHFEVDQMSANIS